MLKYFIGIFFFISTLSVEIENDPRPKIKAFLPKAAKNFYKIEQKFLTRNMTISRKYACLMSLLKDEQRMMKYVLDFWLELEDPYMFGNNTRNQLQVDIEQLLDLMDEPKKSKGKRYTGRIFELLRILREASQMRLRLFHAGYVPYDEYVETEHCWLRELKDNFTLLYTTATPKPYWSGVMKYKR
uniref:Uncharacterized protein n=1 Tax=Clastoptera arizonana TaxID=38151 RepID=A0A1B6E6C1_9HEMI